MTKPNLPPGPRTPAIFQLLQFATRPIDFFAECEKRYGQPFTVDMANFGKFVMISSPDLIKQVFTGDSAIYHAGRANRDLEPFVGKRSLLLLDGAEHLRHRRLLMPPFHGERMRTYAKIMFDGARASVAKMPVGREFAIHPFMQTITLEIILQAVFGLVAGAEKDRMFDVLVEYLEPPSPVLMFLPQVDLPLMPFRAFLRRREAVDAEIYATIARRKEALARGAQHDDILSLLLGARDEAGAPLTDSELRDELVTLLIAGHETTATALSWAFERVLSTPDVEAKLMAEIDGAERSADAIANLEYLEGVVKETLRMRPILPDVVREIQEPVRLGDYDLPKGMRICPVISLAHQRADNWPSPERFDPQRFVGAKIDPYAWFPFGGGIRRCLGMAFAMYEMKIVLGTVLAHARFRLARKGPVRVVRRGVTLAPDGGTPVVLSALTDRPS